MTNSTTGSTPVLSWLQKGPPSTSHATFAILFVSRSCGTLAVRKWTPPSTPASYGTAVTVLVVAQYTIAVHAHVDGLDASEPVGRGRHHVDGLLVKGDEISTFLGTGTPPTAGLSTRGTQRRRALPSHPESHPEQAVSRASGLLRPRAA